jgi:hypothetical protein
LTTACASLPFPRPSRAFATVLLALAWLPAQAAQRAFVASTGNDANAATGCTLAAPCRSFQAGHGAVDAGGEIVALDTAGYGPITISKSVTVVGVPGAIAGISVASGNGVTIATALVEVALRNLSINGTGGLHGVSMTAGNGLTIENCVISNFTGTGLTVATVAAVTIADTVMRGNGSHGAFLAAGAKADVANSRFMRNAGTGLFLDSSANVLTTASVSDSVASNNGSHGFAASATLGYLRSAFIRTTAANNGGAGYYNEALSMNANNQMSLSNILSSRNAIGIYNSSSIPVIAWIESLGNNAVHNNTLQTDGPISIVPGV